MGAANMQLPVARELQEQGHSVHLVVDKAGMAGAVFERAGMPYSAFATDQIDLLRDMIEGVNLVFIGQSASASGLELASLSERGCPAVVGSDGFFNHALPTWRKALPDNWFAIDEGHAAAIAEIRPFLEGGEVIVTGQPAFDAAMGLICNREEIRERRRAELNLRDGQKMVLWWSQGTAQVITTLGEIKNAVFVARIHPKLDKTVAPGYVEDVSNMINGHCKNFGVGRIFADDIPGEQLCLAADLIVSVTCTEDIKSTLMGGSPVLHFLGPEVARWFTNDFGLQFPYLPDVKMGTALAAYALSQVRDMVQTGLNPETAWRLRTDWHPPQKLATQRVVEELLRLAK